MTKEEQKELDDLKDAQKKLEEAEKKLEESEDPDERDVDEKLENGEITEDEANNRKRKLKRNAKRR